VARHGTGYPNPTIPTEHWVKFATMQPGDTAFDDLTGLTQEADSVRPSRT
jgi:hypothetical protein